jgi:hypothetical protein
MRPLTTMLRTIEGEYRIRNGRAEVTEGAMLDWRVDLNALHKNV